MKANAERIEKNTVLLEIEVDAEKFTRAMEQAYRKLVKKFNVPGFRKGKTPRPIFERYIGRDALYEEAMDGLVPEAYVDAVKDTGIEPIEQPNVEVVQAEEGKPVVLKAMVQVKPEVKLGQYKELEVVKTSFAITEEDVEKELEALRDKHAELLVLEEGKVENGDISVIDFLGKINGEPFKGGESKDYNLEIGSGSFIAGFEEQITGMSIGETKDIQVTFPDNYQAEELAGKDAVFTVTVKEIKRKKLPAIDNEFAKDVSEFDTLEELRNDISNKLKQAAENNSEMLFRNKAVENAVQNAEIELPEIMIENKLAEMFRNLELRLVSQGINLSDYLEYSKISPDKLKSDMRPDAELSLKTDLVLNAIAKLEEIKVSDEEVQKETEKIAAQYRQAEADIRAMLEEQGKMSMIEDGILKEKTVEFLVNSAKVVEDTKKQDTE
jgi:trigger factor